MFSPQRKGIFRIAMIQFLFIVITGCNTSLNKNVSDQEDSIYLPPTLFEKLTGTWQVEKRNHFEQWSKKSDGTYECKGFKVVGKDTSFYEKATIYPDRSNWVFENTVNDQNEGRPVKFISTFLTPSIVHFSNPEHDFPTDIQYEMTGDNTLKAFISGPGKNNLQDTIYFYFKRVN